MLPDAFIVRLADPDVRFVDSKAFEIGKGVTLSFCSPDNRQLKQVFDGEITALEPEFTQEGILLTIRGYDRSHRLNRVRKAATFHAESEVTDRKYRVVALLERARELATEKDSPADVTLEGT